MLRQMCFTGIAGSLLLFSIPSQADAAAAILQFDFRVQGDANPAYVGDNAPAQKIDGVDANANKWVTVRGGNSNGSTTSGTPIPLTGVNIEPMIDAYGNAVTGVELQIGRSQGTQSAPTDAMTWYPSAVLAGFRFGHPTFDGFLPVTGNIASTMRNSRIGTGDGGTNDRSMGVRIRGLNPGVYDFYVITVARTGITKTTIETIIGNFGTTGQTRKDPNALATAVVEQTSHKMDAWLEGNNYAKFRLTITDPTQWVSFIQTRDSTVGPSPSFENFYAGFQVVAIPEPASISLLSLSSMMLLRRRGH